MKGLQININQAPKVIRKKAKQVLKLWKEFNVIKLRELRDSSTTVEINIYHHSMGTDSYFHDLGGKYYSWEKIESITAAKMESGKTVLTVVMPYKSGMLFHKSSLAPHPSLN